MLYFYVVINLYFIFLYPHKTSYTYYFFFISMASFFPIVISLYIYLAVFGLTLSRIYEFESLDTSFRSSIGFLKN